MRFGDAGEVILTLTDAGELTEIPVPTGRPQRPASGEGRKPVSKRTKPSTRRSQRAATGGAGSPQDEQASGKSAGWLGPCPLCGSEVIEQEKSYSCSGWRSGCKFAIWKTIAGKRISARTAQALLHRGTSPVLKGFKSKSGGAFDARLKLDQGQVRFDFGS
jgi:DNA topoisomerase-3